MAEQLLADRAVIAAAVEEAGIDAHYLPSVFAAAGEWSDRLRSATHLAPALVQVIDRVVLTCAGLEVSLTVPLSIGAERNTPDLRFGVAQIHQIGQVD